MFFTSISYKLLSVKKIFPKGVRLLKNEYNSCKLCARLCGVNRENGELGACKSSEKIKIARAALHFWEEPIISGTRGSGTIFFSGCSLSCVYCQNSKISHGGAGKEISCERLSEIMLELEAKGAHNINLVTPTHFAPSIKNAIISAKNNGLKIPIVYNTSSFDTQETLHSLSGLVDVYLADYKYFRSESAKKYSRAENYPKAALLAIDEMYRQKPVGKFSEGLMTEGIIIRILLLPNHVAEAKLILSKLYKRYGDNVYYSLMNQYTPQSSSPYPINRKVTREEYRELISYAMKLGIKNAFVQEGGAASESFIPDFNNEGV